MGWNIIRVSNARQHAPINPKKSRDNFMPCEIQNDGAKTPIFRYNQALRRIPSLIEHEGNVRRADGL